MKRAALFAMAALGALPACNCGDVGVGKRAYACASDADCANGFVCLEGGCVLPGADGGALTDAGPADAGTTDAGRSDGGVSDAGMRDAGPPDAGSRDSGVVDAGPGYVIGTLADGGVYVDFDGDGGCVQGVSIAVDPLSGNPAIAWFQGADLLITECTGGCSDGGVWLVPSLVEKGVVPDCTEYYQDVSLGFFPGGNPAMVYVDAAVSPNPVHFAVRAGGAWHISVVGDNNDFGNIAGNFPASVAFTGSTAEVAYHNAAVSQLIYGACTQGCDTGVGTAWVTQILATGTLQVARFASIAVEPASGLPRIAFGYDPPTASSPMTQFATCHDVDAGITCAKGQGVWSIGAIDPGVVAEGVSLVYSGGVPAVLYADADGGRVKYARCATNCGDGLTSTWNQLDVSPPLGTSPLYLSLGFDGMGAAFGAFNEPASKGIELGIGPPAPAWSHGQVDTSSLYPHLSMVVGSGGKGLAYSMGARLRYRPLP